MIRFRVDCSHGIPVGSRCLILLLVPLVMMLCALDPRVSLFRACFLKALYLRQVFSSTAAAALSTTEVAARRSSSSSIRSRTVTRPKTSTWRWSLPMSRQRQRYCCHPKVPYLILGRRHRQWCPCLNWGRPGAWGSTRTSSSTQSKWGLFSTLLSQQSTFSHTTKGCMHTITNCPSSSGSSGR